MELRQLRYFVTVVEEANFTRAAARLHVAQPGVSAQIGQLERELGQRLLDRSGRAVTPTEVGAAVLPYARAALGAVDAVRETVDEFTGLLRGRVAIGIVSGAATHEFDMAGLLAGFHASHPEVEIALTEDTSERMLGTLREGELDIAMVGLAETGPLPGLALRLVVDEPLVAAMAPGDALASGEGELPLSALRGRRLICLPRGTGVRGVLDRLCAAAGFTPHIAFEAAAPHLLVQLAARGLGVAIVPSLPVETAESSGLRLRSLAEPRARGRIALAWRTDGPSSPAAQTLLDLLHDTLPTPHAPAAPQAEAPGA
ncbi:LysR family transcriptional regulator [Streptomyces sp. NPDC059875]|uniref:LysR family transcriptional regulator n=1 Tax=unclassified Streptomyces TaxID=2593676 RepID=UPI00365D8DA3